jgi:hypothetical protein
MVKGRKRGRLKAERLKEVGVDVKESWLFQ